MDTRGEEHFSDDTKEAERVPFWAVVFCHLFYVLIYFAFARLVVDFDSIADLSLNRVAIMPLLIPTIVFVIFITVHIVRDCRNRIQKGYWVRSKYMPKSWVWAIAGCATMWFLVPMLIDKIGKTGKETIDGVTWRYKIVDGNAVIRRSRPWQCSAISVSTAGDLTIPSSLDGHPVTAIGEYAFYKCSKLTSVTIPNCVTNIDRCAFAQCGGLTSVEIPGNVAMLGLGAFGGCGSLATVKLRGRSCLAWGGAFDSCSALAEFEVAPENQTCKVVDGMLLSKGGTRLLAGVNGAVEIPEGVTEIGSWAFSGREITSITLPNTVTNIEMFAFENCHRLTTVEIPNGVASIGLYAFHGCDGLTSVTIPNGVTGIGAWAFSGCHGLTSVALPESVTFIGNDAYHGCSNLSSISIPSNIVHIMQNAFAETPFFDNMPEGLIVFSGIAYRWKGKCPESVSIPDGVTRIYESAFENCFDLKSVVIPNSITNIGRSAFCNCRRLTYLEIPEGVTDIEPNAFYGCDSLSEVSIPRSLTRIDGYFWANIKKVYMSKGDVERVKSLFRESGNKNIVDYAEFVEREEAQSDHASSSNVNGQLK